jgi:hypothetical protein
MEKPHYVVVVRPGVELIDSVVNALGVSLILVEHPEVVGFRLQLGVHVVHAGDDADQNRHEGSPLPEGVQSLVGDHSDGVQATEDGCDAAQGEDHGVCVHDDRAPLDALGRVGPNELVHGASLGRVTDLVTA